MWNGVRVCGQLHCLPLSRYVVSWRQVRAIAGEHHRRQSDEQGCCRLTGAIVGTAVIDNELVGAVNEVNPVS